MKKKKYSNNKILKVLISFGEYSLEYLRDIAKIKKEVKISFIQLNQRISYFPKAKVAYLLDWERISKSTEEKSEFKASYTLLKRLVSNLRTHRIRVRAIVGDKLYFSTKFFEIQGLKDVSEGFVTKPRDNSQLKSEKLLLKLKEREKFYKGRMKIKGNSREENYRIYEIDELSSGK